MITEDKVVAFVPVRLTSTRLPKKHFKPIGDKMLLSWVIYRLKECRNVSQIVICAPNESESQELIDFASNEAVELFIYDGDVNDVVGRLTRAAELYQADICVLASGDCPLLNPPTIDLMIDSLTDYLYDAAYVVFEPVNDGFPIHEGILAAKRWLWVYADRVSDTPYLREHHFPVYVQNVYPEKFSHAKIASVRDRDVFYSVKHRISVDTPSDLEFMNRVYDALKDAGKGFNLEDVIELLNAQPQFKEINASVHQKTYNAPSVNVLYYAAMLQGDGYDNLLRGSEVARVLMDRFGAGVRFLVSEEKAREFLETRGVTTFIGTYDRLSEVYAKFQYDTVIFDVNAAFDMPCGFLSGLSTSMDVRTVVIGNTTNGSLEADLVIAPHLYDYIYDAPNVKGGKEFIVIRDEIKKVKPLSINKDDVMVIYSYGEPIMSLLPERLKKADLRFTIKDFSGYDVEFPKQLATAKILVTTLGVAAYEAIYLGTVPALLSLTDQDRMPTQLFYEAYKEFDPTCLDNGAENVASEIIKLTSKG